MQNEQVGTNKLEQQESGAQDHDYQSWDEAAAWGLEIEEGGY